VPDLFDSLKQLDHDPSVQPLPAAEVRRRGDRMRRRRGALEALTALAVVAVVVAGSALVEGRSGSGHAGPATQGPTQSAAPTTPDAVALTNDGYGTLRLTMDAAEARDAGLTELRGSASAPCRTGRTTDGGVVYLSKQHGVAGIFLRNGMVTDRGIGLGSTKADVLAAYPNGTYDVHGYWVTKPSAGVRLQVAMPHGTVEEVGLSLVDQDCFG
jgi:hypothetical protein